MVAKRVATAVIGIPVAIFIINYGQWLFGLAISFLALVAWYEYVKMMENKQLKPSFWIGIIGVTLFLGCAWFGNPLETATIAILCTLIVLGKTVMAYHHFSLPDAAFTLLGLFYIGLSFSHLLLLRFVDMAFSVPSTLSLSYGALYLWIAFLGTWASDTFAYFVGTKFGRTKLCPAISPSKTREGALGGLAGSVITIVIFGSQFGVPAMHLLCLGLVVGVAAPVGDLVESVMKRYAGVKDSGKFFPGHGGVLDRFDSILFAVPAVYYYVQVFLLR